MKDKIEVEIFKREIVDFPLGKNIDCFFLGKLKAHGIPVEGVLLLRGVESGTLTKCENIENDSVVFTWEK